MTMQPLISSGLTKQFLEHTHPFKALSKEMLNTILAHAMLRHYDKGESICHEGELADSLWVVEKRIATILVQLFKTHGNAIPLTRRDVAALACTTVESTIRTLSVFGKKGWLLSSRDHIALRTASELQKFLEPA